ncbi:MAG: DUF4147 domain-containing protein [Acidobacteria bacterium]|nr:DUF4147 domain-containing protein [Acidobacteriota bacterium]
MPETIDLRQHARAIFDEALRSVDAARAVRCAVSLAQDRLTIIDTNFDPAASARKIYSVALGKAGGMMAMALDEILGARLSGGIVSTSSLETLQLSARWQAFAGGHPLPNEASMAAARAAFALLRRADGENSALVIFLVSGGGSAMMEWPCDEAMTLEDLRETNRALVTCGAGIAEINTVRRSLSAVKGGGLSACAPHAAQITLIISDTAPGDALNVASGPSLQPVPDGSDDAALIIARYGLAARLPASVVRSINEASRRQTAIAATNSLRRHHVLLDNESALDAAAQSARARGFRVEIARDINDQSIAEGCALLVSRLDELRRQTPAEQSCALISGGEFSCPVRGEGIGGRNTETVLRCALELAAHAKENPPDAPPFVILSAGTDGIDGNSPAAGALCDETTLNRAHELNLNAASSLAASDAYTFFHALGDALHTGPTGTNVRDLRILLSVQIPKSNVQGQR